MSVFTRAVKRGKKHETCRLIRDGYVTVSGTAKLAVGPERAFRKGNEGDRL